LKETTWENISKGDWKCLVEVFTSFYCDSWVAYFKVLETFMTENSFSEK
jgi:hypothetical protein